MILKAEPLDPTFTWRGHKPEGWRWRSIGVLLAITAGAAFYVGRLSSEASAPTALSVVKQADPKPEQNAASAGPVAQRQAAVQPEASKAAPEARDGAKAKPADVSTETAKTQSTAAAAGGSSRPPVVLINPNAADKASGGDAAKQPVSRTGAEAVDRKSVV